MTDKPSILVADGTIYESPDGSRWCYSMEHHRWLLDFAREEYRCRLAPSCRLEKTPDLLTRDQRDAGFTAERAVVLQVPSGVALEWEAMLTREDDTADWSAGLGDGYELHDYWCALVPSTPINSTPASDEIEFCEDSGNDISIQLPGGQHVLVRPDYYGRPGHRMLQILCYEHGEDEPVAKIRFSREGKLEEIMTSTDRSIRLYDTDEFNTPWELARGEA